MDINITLFLQAAQFAIAYLFLSKFLFAPAYKILDEQELFEKNLYKNLEQEQLAKKSLEATYKERQKILKDSLINIIPVSVVESSRQKLDIGSTLYQVDAIEELVVDRKKTEDFLIDNLSQVIK